ncbi:Endonuclease V [Arsenophonus endosymbiont of Bemisia tabaci Q2]|nr:Endonuclease V [Arsenophonus endosymbiont of Bemisia tabaci Q2]
MVDGQGIAHPRRFGVASHLGLLLDIPTIGIVKSRLCGHHEALDEIVESRQPLNDNNEQIPCVFRSKKRCKPLYISLGHKISLDASLLWVKHCIKGYRLPEPTRLVNGIASNRAIFNRMKQNLA